MELVGTQSRSSSLAVKFKPFDVSRHIGELRPGTNLLAIQLLNTSAINSDALLVPQLVGGTGSSGGVSPKAVGFSESLQLDASTVVTARPVVG